MDQMYLDNIEEALEDEVKIVSYKWLSLHLKVPANTAKQMLSEYLNTKRSDSSKLWATYLISGILYDKKLAMELHQVCVVKDSNLDWFKSKMKTVYSIHVYSLQKCRLRDLNVIQASNLIKIRENMDEATKYSHISLPSLKYRPKVEAKTVTVQVNKNNQPKETQMKYNNVVNNPSRQIPLQKSKIASMFANQNKNIEAGTKANPVKKPAKNKNALSAFLVKKEPAALKMENITTKMEPIQKEDINPIKNETVGTKINSPNVSSPQKKMNSSPVSYQSKKKSPIGRAKSTNHKKRKSKTNTTSQAKRRRILQLESSDSSSDEIMSEEEKEKESIFPPVSAASPIPTDSDDEIIPATPQENTRIAFSGHKRIGKLVDKTFTDEEGFLVTKKEYICVSDASDEDNPATTNKSEVTNKAAKISPKKNTIKKVSPKKSNLPLAKPKQPSIMNFFKKK